MSTHQHAQIEGDETRTKYCKHSKHMMYELSICNHYSFSMPFYTACTIDSQTVQRDAFMYSQNIKNLDLSLYTSASTVLPARSVFTWLATIYGMMSILFTLLITV